MRSILARWLAASALAVATSAGCAQSFVAVRNEAHPAGGHYLVSATIEEWPNGYYSTAVTIRNVSTRELVLQPQMFRLEGTAPTSFVPAGRMPMFMGRAGYRMPEKVAPRSSAQGEIFFGIRGTKVPAGPVTLVVTLPDGEHSFEFDLIQ
jgi:hypothetical protein